LEQDPDFLANSKGRVLYMDNYYTSESVMDMLWKDYGIFTVGTYSLTKKKSRTVNDFAFHKLSGGAKNKVTRGWMRWAQKKVVDSANRVRYFIQNTTWMDRKQVGIMHNHLVGPPGDYTTMRYDRSKRARVAFPSHPIVPDYVMNMKGVDKTDRAMADWNISLKSIKYYLRIFWYAFTAAVANMRVVTFEIVRQVKEQRVGASKEDPWEKYTKGSRGVFDWMMDIGHTLIAKGILMAWDVNDPFAERPSWMRQKPFLPCSCKRCFFAKPKSPQSMVPPFHRPLKLLQTQALQI
jgi:hypothetical protein